MKKLCCFMLCLLLLLSAAAQAEVCSVICVGCTVNGLTRVDFETSSSFTAIADDPNAVTGWKLNGRLVEGENKLYLIFTAEGNTVVEAVYGDGKAQPDTENSADPATADAGDRRLVVTAVGAHLQYLNGDGIGAGESFTSIDFTEDYRNPVTGNRCEGGSVSFKVCADTEHRSNIDYWVINGVRYDFENTIRFITVTGLTESTVFEVVLKNKQSQTLLTDSQIQAGRTGKPLVVRTPGATLALIQGKMTVIGPHVDTFDFTEDYKNPKTGAMITGGKCDIKVVAKKADSDLYDRVRYWKFNKANFTFDANISYFYVHGLYCPMLYSPRYGMIPMDFDFDEDDGDYDYDEYFDFYSDEYGNYYYYYYYYHD